MLLCLTRAAAEQRGTTVVLDGIEVSHVVKGNTVSVAIGPTDSLHDLWRSLRCKPISWPGDWSGMVHQGAHEGALLVYDYLVEKRVVHGKRSKIAGSSMGGYLARNLALMLHESGFDVVWLETYGEPATRCGEERIEWPGHRYVCGWDPVPSLTFGGYRHEGPATVLDSPWLIPGPWDHMLASYRRALDGSIHADT